MDDWHATYLGRRRIPRDLTAFELEAFFSFMAAERRAIEDRRGPALRLGLALQVGFLRMSGRLLGVGDRKKHFVFECTGRELASSSLLFPCSPAIVERTARKVQAVSLVAMGGARWERMRWRSLRHRECLFEQGSPCPVIAPAC